MYSGAEYSVGSITLCCSVLRTPHRTKRTLMHVLRMPNSWFQSWAQKPRRLRRSSIGWFAGLIGRCLCLERSIHGSILDQNKTQFCCLLRHLAERLRMPGKALSYIVCSWFASPIPGVRAKVWRITVACMDHGWQADMPSTQGRLSTAGIKKEAAKCGPTKPSYLSGTISLDKVRTVMRGRMILRIGPNVALFQTRLFPGRFSLVFFLGQLAVARSYWGL